MAISDIAVYPVEEFLERAGLSEEHLRKLKRDGLPIVRIGRRRMISGRDFHEFVRRQFTAPTGEAV